MIQAEYDLLERHFDTAFAAPEGIAKLRELILTLAMHGKLVEQDPNDPSASELLKTIEKEKQQLVKVGKIKKPKALPTIEQSDAPYALPKGWIWTRLGNIGNIFNGNSINAREKETKYAGANGLPYIATKDVGYGLDELDYKNGIYIPESEEKFKVAHKGSVLICAEGGSAGKKCGVTEQDICFGNKLFANELFGGIPSKFILYLYLSPVFREAFNGAMTGIIGGVSIAKFLELPVPLPPLEEQNRIVTRINQLMVRCDELEKLRNAREEKRRMVHATAIKQLLSAPENTVWPFIQQHFGELYTVKENVSELRKAILQLAVMGRLVPQDPNDPPASELLEKIEAEKQRLIADKKIRKQTPLPPIKSEEMPYQLPQGWEWVRLGSVMQFINGDRGKNYPSKDKLSSEGIPFISAVNLKNGTVSNEDLLCVSEEQYAKLGSGKLKKNDLVFCIRGSLGKKAIYPFERGAIASSLVILRSYLNADEFLRFTDSYMASPFLFSEIRKYDNGTAQPNLSANNFMRFLLPFPSLPEQRRIVACIDQLMELCDKLDAQIDATTFKQEALLNAVMAQV